MRAGTTGTTGTRTTTTTGPPSWTGWSRGSTGSSASSGWRGTSCCTRACRRGSARRARGGCRSPRTPSDRARRRSPSRRRMPVVADHHVRWLQVTVEEALRVREGHRVAHREEDHEVLLEVARRALLAQQIEPRPPLHELHGEHRPPVRACCRRTGAISTRRAATASASAARCSAGAVLSASNSACGAVRLKSGVACAAAEKAPNARTLNAPTITLARRRAAVLTPLKTLTSLSSSSATSPAAGATNFLLRTAHMVKENLGGHTPQSYHVRRCRFGDWRNEDGSRTPSESH